MREVASMDVQRHDGRSVVITGAGSGLRTADGGWSAG
jgi:hypothetical protein